MRVRCFFLWATWNGPLLNSDLKKSSSVPLTILSSKPFPSFRRKHLIFNEVLGKPITNYRWTDRQERVCIYMGPVNYLLNFYATSSKKVKTVLKIKMLEKRPSLRVIQLAKVLENSTMQRGETLFELHRKPVVDCGFLYLFARTCLF